MREHKFKVGDIVTFSTEHRFREIMFQGTHIVTEVNDRYISTKGNGWNYENPSTSQYNELNSRKEIWQYIHVVGPKEIKYDGSGFKFRFV